MDIDPAGNVIDVTVVESSGNTSLDNSAEKQVRNWKFEPSENGQQNLMRSIRFRLDDP
ncbi:energy transducer TonB [Laspinema sp. D1]|nr:energy transducer TonB [Laspinema sp. D2b]